MPSGFRGTSVAISKVTIEGRTTGSVIRVAIQFCDANGLVHAITQHELEPTADPRVAATIQPFMTALRSWVEQLHFENAETLSSGKVTTGGIAEALRGSTDPDDGVGSEG
jgi:hypothetical protein